MANLLDTTINGNLNVTGHIINGGVVRYDINNQGLTDTQKSNARTNIGASNFTGYTASNKLSTNYINNVAGWTANTGTITEVKTNAGAHTTIDVTSGKAEFNVPTNTSHLTNDSNFIDSSSLSTTLESYVTLAGTGETISATKTFSANQVLNNNKFLQGKDTNGTARDLIGYDSYNSICLGNASHNLFAMTNLNTYPTDTNSLGSSAYKWKDLYLSGNLSDGTNSISVANIANKNNVPVSYSTTETSPSQCTSNGFYHTRGTSSTGDNANPFYSYHSSNTDFRIIASAYNSNYVAQIATDYYTDHIAFRRNQNGTWQSWVEIPLRSDCSSDGNATANKIISRNATGSIQTEKLAISSGTTTKATWQYNSNTDCVELRFA